MKSNTASTDPVEELEPRHRGERVVTDGNQIISRVAYKTNGGIVIYTITPSSPFGEEAAKRAAKMDKNIYGAVPQVLMACDEAAAASFIQGLAAKGVGSATASSSQGILLMIPEMFNTAGQLLPVTFYIGARDITRHSLTIFAGHSDVYAVRDTGVIILFARDAQELQDLGAIAERLKWEVSLPVAVVYDGFLTSHRQTQLDMLSEEFFWEFMPHDLMIRHKERSLDPAHPTVWGTNENPDGYMQAGLAQRPHTLAVATVLPRLLKEFGALTGRHYNPYKFYGHPEATDIIIAAGSSLSTLQTTVEHLLRDDPNRRIGVVSVTSFRPFLLPQFIDALPASVERIAVLDRSMTHTAQDEPLCADVSSAVQKAYQGFADVPKLERLPIVTGGIYGLAGKDFHPGSVLEVFNHLQSIKETGKAWTNFVVGVTDDVMFKSLPFVDAPDIFEGMAVKEARIVAYGSDGTVSMIKSAAEIYAAQPNELTGKMGLYIASHAEYDSKKAGGVTVSSFRCAQEEINECFDVLNPDYVAIHHPALIRKRDGILDGITKGGVLVINTSQAPDKVYASLPEDMQAAIIANEVSVFAIDAFRLAAEEGLGNKISMVMMRVLFDRFGLITAEAADEAMETRIRRAFASKGDEIVTRNVAAFKRAIEALAAVPLPDIAPAQFTAPVKTPAPITLPTLDFEKMIVPSPEESGFRREIQGPGLAGRGNDVTVASYFNYARGGARPVDTWKDLDRGFAIELPEFQPWNCNACGQCAFICPTGDALTQGILDLHKQDELADVPLARVFRDVDQRPEVDQKSGFLGMQAQAEPAYGLAVDPNLCTGCGICVEVCSKDALQLKPATAEHHQALANRRKVLEQALEVGAGIDYSADVSQSRHSMSEMETFPNYVGTSGACAGCYEPLYVSKFLQLYPDTVISNATGCSSIWGAQAYETPYSTDEAGHGAAWVNPLFENNAAVGGGLALGIASETDQMNVSGNVLISTLREHEVLASNSDVQKLIRGLVELHGRTPDSSMENRVSDRFERIEDVRQIQATLDRVLALPEIASDQKLRTHAKLLKATITSALDKKTLIVGGDGWAFDIGLQMMMHVLQSQLDVTIMVLVTDVYSNTGGQMSKATPMGMNAPFAPAGKPDKRFPLGISVASGANAYVAQVNLEYPNHMMGAYKDAVAFKGPSLLMCYVPCMTAQKFPANEVPTQAKRATTTRYWPLYTYNPGTDVWSIEGNPESRRGEAKLEGDFIQDFCAHEKRFSAQFDAEGKPSQLLQWQTEDNMRIWSLLQRNAGVTRKD